MKPETFLLPLRKLNEDNVPYVVIGGLAVILHGHFRITANLDLAVSLEKSDLEKLISTLNSLGYVPRLPIKLEDFLDPVIRDEWLKTKNMKALNIWRPGDPFSSLDIVFDLPLSFDELKRNSIEITLEETKVRIASAEDLIKIKQRAGRALDLADVKALEEIKRRSDG